MRSNQATVDTASRAGWIGHTLPGAGSLSIRRLLRSYSRRGLRPLHPKMAKVESILTPAPVDVRRHRWTSGCAESGISRLRRITVDVSGRAAGRVELPDYVYHATRMSSMAHNLRA